MRFATLLLKIPENWMTDLLKEHDIHIRVFNCMPYSSGGGRGLLRLSSNEKLDVLIDKIRAREEVLRVSFNRVSNRAVMGEVVIDKCAACSALKQSDCFMISSKSRNDKWLEWAVAAESNSMIHDLIEKLKKNRCDVHLTKISASHGASGLTQRQDEIFQFAYNNGYYEYPRRISLRNLSVIFGISPSTMSEILRAGQRRVFSDYFGNLSV